MRARFLAVFMIAVVLSVPAGGAVPARAQNGGLTPEEITLLDRVYTARANFKALTSFSEKVSGVDTREVTLGKIQVAQSFSTAVNWTRTMQVINQGDSRNIQSQVTAAIQNQGVGLNGRQASVSYTIKAEIRFVGGKLYVNAAYDAAQVSPQWPKLPTGWIEITDATQWPALQDLYLSEYLQDNTMFDDEATVKAAEPTVTSQPGTLDDGTPVDIVTVAFNTDSARKLYSTLPGANDPLTTAMLAHLGDKTQLSLSVVIDAQNMVRQTETNVTLQGVGMDASVFSQNRFPAGASADLTISYLRTTTYSDFNATLVPAAVPEGVGQ